METQPGEVIEEELLDEEFSMEPAESVETEREPGGAEEL